MRHYVLAATVLLSAAACSSQQAPQPAPEGSRAVVAPVEADPIPAVAPSGHPTLHPPNEGHQIPDGTASKVTGIEGTYCTAHEIAGFSGTVLELKAGKFRYWFYSDVGDGQPKYPIAGAYLFQDGKLTLNHEHVPQQIWFADLVNGVPVLWRPDGLKSWQQDKRIHDYGVLIKVEGGVTNADTVARPSIKVLYAAENRPKNATKQKNKGTDRAILGSLHQAFAAGPDESALKLVRDNPTLVHDMDDSDCTALHYAARYGRVGTAKWLIEQKADVNTVSYNGFTPMHVVTDAAVARSLIKAGANLNTQDNWGKTPLQNAAQMERKEVSEAILEAGFPIDLTTALWLGKRDLVKKMIKDNPAIAKQADGGSDLWGNTTPLGIAAGQGDREIVELLLKAGAPVNAYTERPASGGWTALSNAVLAKQFDVAEILCKAGADCNVSAGKFYPRLLDYATKHSESRMVELLKKYGGKASERE